MCLDSLVGFPVVVAAGGAVVDSDVTNEPMTAGRVALVLVALAMGGFAIGVFQHGLTVGQAADSYILLAVGDALVAQIPGLLISVAAAMVVSRVGKEHDLGRQIVHQILVSPKVLGITASPGGPEKFGRDMARDLSRYAGVVKSANIKAE